MTSSSVRFLRIALAAAVLSTGLTACSNKPKEHWWQFWRKPAPALAPSYASDEAFPPTPSPGMGGGLDGESALGTADRGGMGIQETRGPSGSQPMGQIPALPTIYFDFDSDELKPTERAVLDKSAEWLLSNPAVMVQLEGHCDERGTPEYNLNLGGRRAGAVREYLVGKGVNPNQLATISYGEERPVDPGQDEQAYRLNRRVEFLVY